VKQFCHNAFQLYLLVQATFLGVNFSYAQLKPKIQIIEADQFSFRKIAELPAVINEASGLAIYDKDSLFWTHNDGGKSILYGIDSTGEIRKTIHLKNKNKGWEDLAIDSEGNFYIAATGNNRNDKKDLKVYKLPPLSTIDHPISLAEPISFKYEDQLTYPAKPENANFDCDALISIRDSLYLFTKNRTDPYNGIINIYALPNKAGTYEAKKVDSFKLDGAAMDNWITGADISKDGSLIALLFHNKILFIEKSHTERVSEGNFYQLNLGHFSHKAGICFTAKNEVYIVDENELNLLGGNIYHLNIQYFIK
jgi:hypothetical protein